MCAVLQSPVPAVFWGIALACVAFCVRSCVLTAVVAGEAEMMFAEPFEHVPLNGRCDFPSRTRCFRALMCLTCCQRCNAAVGDDMRTETGCRRAAVCHASTGALAALSLGVIIGLYTPLLPAVNEFAAELCDGVTASGAPIVVPPSQAADVVYLRTKLCMEARQMQYRPDLLVSGLVLSAVSGGCLSLLVWRIHDALRRLPRPPVPGTWMSEPPREVVVAVGVG